MQEQNTDSKNQHYVPKFYLRHFSLKNNEKTIKLFNIKSEKFIATASIKHQASSNFYYGKDGNIETRLSGLEGFSATRVSEILTALERPKYYSKEHIELLTFAISTDLRNPVRKKTYEQQTDGMIKKILSMEPDFKDKPEFKKVIDHIKIIPKDSAYYALNFMPYIIELTLDLHIKLLINNTSTPFITSDNPIIKYNQFLEYKSNSNSITGYALQGLQMFVPLNEKIQLLFYDEQIYYVGSRKTKNVTLDNVKDVDQLNMLQMVNCYCNVYGSDMFTPDYARSLSIRAKVFPSFHQVRQNSVPASPNEKGEFVFQSVDSVKTNLYLSFVFLSTYGGRFPKLGNKTSMRKHAEIIRERYERERDIQYQLRRKNKP